MGKGPRPFEHVPILRRGPGDDSPTIRLVMALRSIAAPGSQDAWDERPVRILSQSIWGGNGHEGCFAERFSGWQRGGCGPGGGANCAGTERGRRQKGAAHHRVFAYRCGVAVAVERWRGLGAGHVSQRAESDERDAGVPLYAQFFGALPLGGEGRCGHVCPDQAAHSRGTLGGGGRMAGGAGLQYSFDGELCAACAVWEGVLPAGAGSGCEDRDESRFVWPRGGTADDFEERRIWVLRVHAPAGARDAFAAPVLVGGAGRVAGAYHAHLEELRSRKRSGRDDPRVEGSTV